MVMAEGRKQISIIGSGNWGSAIARIVGRNATRFPDTFDPKVRLWVFEEVLPDGRKLTEVVNTQHENVKYLPGFKFPENVVAVPDIVDAAVDADIVIFVVPHQFMRRAIAPLVGKLKPDAIGMSLIKGFELLPEGGIDLISRTLSKTLGIQVGVLMGANLAPEVAAEKFCETTIGYADRAKARMLKDLFQTENFRVTVTSDATTVEICGALKNIVAVGAGFTDGLGYGDNTKAAVIRLGLMEMIRFGELFFPGGRLATYFESCGVADLVTTCYGGRNRRIAEAFVTSGKTIEELETELLNGQRLQGPETAAEVFVMLENGGHLEKFPLFVAIHRICSQQIKPDQMIECIREHPEHLVLDPDRTLVRLPATSTLNKPVE